MSIPGRNSARGFSMEENMPRSRFLTLPLHIREAIYEELLNMRNTIEHHIDRGWDTVEVVDDMVNSDVPTDWMSSLCPRTTSYNFHTDILYVNRQIHVEAREYIGRKNQWIILRVLEDSLGKELEKTGTAIPIPASWTLSGSGGENRAAADILVGGSIDEHASPLKMYLMGVDGVWDLVVLLMGCRWQPDRLHVRIFKDAIFPYSDAQNFEHKICDALKLLRITESFRGQRNDGPTIIVERFESGHTEIIHLPTRSFHDIEVLRLLRDWLPPFSTDTESIDWDQEEVRMAEWGFLFGNSMHKYGVQQSIGPIWRDTLSMCHARLMVIHLGKGWREAASFHSERSWDMLETHEKRLFWYEAAFRHILDAKNVHCATEQILEIGWYLSRLENEQWVEFMWLYGSQNSRTELEIVNILIRKAKEINTVWAQAAASGPASFEQRVEIFNRLGREFAYEVTAQLDPRVTARLLNKKNGLLEVDNAPDSFLSIARNHGLPHWFLTPPPSVDVGSDEEEDLFSN
ncbi:hypothetical protein FQN57_001297 [Myotisia sp. PD_48]|nr:hypothetical protein FQN57_001297 [Myotisia sp. PD_48]